MFTGIVIATGRVIAIEDKGGDLQLCVDAVDVESSRLNLGDSVSVQGVCLTVTRREGARFFADVSRETMAKTTLSTLRADSRVNLEPSLRAMDPLGGHLVSGHVDALGRLRSSEQDARSWRLRFELPPALMRYVAPKGSICVNGVSLTVNDVDAEQFDVNIIPHTRAVTTLGELEIGDAVNIEIDVIARYVDRLFSGQK